MSSSIGFYCGTSDNDALEEYARSIGLVLVPPSIDKPSVPKADVGPFCFLSLVPASDLHPYGDPPVRITDARDPLIGFMRAYFKNPYLVAGHIHWSDDVRELAARTKPKFQKLAGWVKKEWERLPGGGFYVGPEAKGLIEKGATMVNVLPGGASSHIVTV
jgi:hypothetical protein